MAPRRTLLWLLCVFVFMVAQLPSGCQAGLQYSEPFPVGEFAACEPCWLGRGRCKRVCAQNEHVVGGCKPNFFCCKRQVH